MFFSLFFLIPFIAKCSSPFYEPSLLSLGIRVDSDVSEGATTSSASSSPSPKPKSNSFNLLKVYRGSLLDTMKAQIPEINCFGDLEKIEPEALLKCVYLLSYRQIENIIAFPEFSHKIPSHYQEFFEKITEFSSRQVAFSIYSDGSQSFTGVHRRGRSSSCSIPPGEIMCSGGSSAFHYHDTAVGNFSPIFAESVPKVNYLNEIPGLSSMSASRQAISVFDDNAKTEDSKEDRSCSPKKKSKAKKSNDLLEFFKMDGDDSDGDDSEVGDDSDDDEDGDDKDGLEDQVEECFFAFDEEEILVKKPSQEENGSNESSDTFEFFEIDDLF